MSDGRDAAALIEVFLATRTPEDHINCLRERVKQLEEQLSSAYLEIAFMEACLLRHEAKAWADTDNKVVQ